MRRDAVWGLIKRIGVPSDYGVVSNKPCRFGGGRFPYEKIGFGEGRFPYEKIGIEAIMAIIPMDL